MQLEGIDHVALAVRDVAESARWYITVLGFEHRYPGQWQNVPTFIGKGSTSIALFPREIREETDADSPKGGILHLAFRADRQNFLAAQKELTHHGIRFEFQDHEISHSIYFRDPNGHQLEITTYQLA